MKRTSLVSKLFTAGKTLTQPQGDKDKNHLTGPCGEHAEWAFSPGDGRLRIFGTGATHDFFGARKLPWKPFLPSIRIICVEEGITYVGFQAFCYANHVEEIRLPLSLLHIGQHCFSYCTDLSAIATYTEDLLMANPDISAFLCLNDNTALTCYGTCAQMGKEDCMVIGFDGSPAGKQSIADGQMTGTMVYSPVDLAKTSFEAAQKLYNGADVDKATQVEMWLISPENVNEYALDAWT